MVKIFLRPVFLMMLLATIACRRSVTGEGPVTSHPRNVATFSRIALSIPANVTFAVSDTIQCSVKAQENIHAVIKTEVDGDELEIKSDYNLESDQPVEIVITAPHLDGLMVNGSGNIKTLNTVKEEEVRLYINGSGELRVSVESDKLRTQVNGSGEIFVSGSSNFHESEVNGSGNLHALDLKVLESQVELNGSGDAEINASEKLDVDITGSGNVIYRGEPHVKSDITGSGSINKEK